jgi:hypothetical protein
LRLNKTASILTPTSFPDAAPQVQVRCSASAQKDIGSIRLDIHSDIFEVLTLMVSERRFDWFFWVIFKINKRKRHW